MGRRLRNDVAGGYYHVVGRGLAQRSILETRRDHRFFLALLARTARRGDLEIVAFCLLTNHYHLLVRSPRGRLSAAMQFVLSSHVRRFNSGRDRDGPLFRARYWSRRIESDRDLRNVFRYVELNAVTADLVERPEQHEFSSAHHTANGRAPKWIQCGLVERLGLRPTARTTELGCAGAAGERLTGAPTASLAWVLERLVTAGGSAASAEALHDADVAKLAGWLEHRSISADGRITRYVFASPDAVLTAIAQAESASATTGSWWVSRGRSPVSGWEVMRCAGLAIASGLSAREIAVRIEAPTTRVRRRLGSHKELVLDRDGTYRARLAAVLREVIDATQGE